MCHIDLSIFVNILDVELVTVVLTTTSHFRGLSEAAPSSRTLGYKLPLFV